MTHYDPNEPQHSTMIPKARVELAERRASPLPLIIGILLALAVAYFALQYFMGRSAVGTTGEDAAVTTTTPADTATTTTAPVTDAADDAAAAGASSERSGEALEDAVTDAKPAADAAGTAPAPASN